MLLVSIGCVLLMELSRCILGVTGSDSLFTDRYVTWCEVGGHVI